MKRSSEGSEGFAAPLPEMESGEVRISSDTRIPSDGGGPMRQGRESVPTSKRRNGLGVKVVEVANASESYADIKDISPSLILSIMETATQLFAPQEILPYNQLEELVVEAIASADGNYGEGEAIKWADGYEFPQELVDSDLRLFRASQLDFTQMVRSWLKQLGSERLSKARVEQLRQDNPERDRLFDIANGMRVPLPPGFTPNGKGDLSPLRPIYIRVHQAVDRMLADLHAQELAFCLPKIEEGDRLN